MKATFKIEEPKTIALTMTITMTLEDWNKLEALIGNEYPGWKFASLISQMVRRAAMHLTDEGEVDS